MAGAISFLIALFPNTRYEIMQFGQWLSFISYVFIIAFPAFLLMVSLLRKRKEEGVNISSAQEMGNRAFRFRKNHLKSSYNDRSRNLSFGFLEPSGGKGGSPLS